MAALIPRRASVSAAFAAALLLVGWDLGRMLQRGTGVPGAASHLGAVVVALGLACAVIGPLLLLRAEIGRRVQGRHRLWHGAAGLVDGLVLLLIWNNPDLRRVLPWGQLVGLLIAGGVVLAAARAWAVGRPRLVNATTALIAVAALGVALLLPWKSAHWTRFGFDLVFAASAAHLLAPRLTQRRLAWVAGALAVLAAVAVEPILRADAGARQLLHHRSIHARGWTLPLLGWADGDEDGAVNILGGHDCDDDDVAVGPAASERPGDGVDQNCDGGDGVAREPVADPPSGAARGSDVLVLSIDALRWDLLEDIPQVRAALGPHVNFTRAITPSSRTIDTLSAVLRGRAVRGVKMTGKTATRRMPTEDPHPTLGTLLKTAGYRAITVPTHRYLAGGNNVFADFEILEPADFQRIIKAPYTLGQPKPTVPSPAAYARLLQAAADTPADTPIVAWVHAMEAHDPYRWSPTDFGPRTEAAMRKSVRYVDGLVAGAIEAWRQRRGAPPVVIIVGDHGEEFGEHGGHYHGSTVYAEQVRVVMLIAGPGLPAATVDAPVSTSGLAATVLDLVGLPPAPTHSERSLLPCLQDATQCPDLAVSEIRSSVRVSVGYTGPRYRLVYDPVNRLEALYDSQTDPFEQRDLAHERPDLLQAARTRARAWDDRH